MVEEREMYVLEFADYTDSVSTMGDAQECVNRRGKEAKVWAYSQRHSETGVDWSLRETFSLKPASLQ